jgi:hypothetical protein
MDAAKQLRQRIPAPEEIMAIKSAAAKRCHGRPPKKVKSCHGHGEIVLTKD